MGERHIYVDLVLEGNVFVEVKYWSRSFLADNIDSVVRQVVQRHDAGADVFLEFGRKASDPTSNVDDQVIRNLLKALGDQGLSVATDPSASASVIITVVP